MFQAYKVYERGAALGVFRSMWQRSLYNVDRLKSTPWWTLDQTRIADRFRVCSTLDARLHMLILICIFVCSFAYAHLRTHMLICICICSLVQTSVAYSRVVAGKGLWAQA